MDCSTPGFPVLNNLPEFAQIHTHWISDPIQPSHPLSSPSPLALIFPSIRIFSSKSALHIRWPKEWSFSFSISPSSEYYSGLISFRIDWFDLLGVQGLSKVFSNTTVQMFTTILWHSTFFTVQHSYVYMTTGKTTAFTRQTFVGKVMSLLLHMLSMFVIAFLPRSKHLLISWL